MDRNKLVKVTVECDGQVDVFECRLFSGIMIDDKNWRTCFDGVGRKKELLSAIDELKKKAEECWPKSDTLH